MLLWCGAVRLNDSYETESHFFLVFELAKTGELFELLTEKVFVPEDVARNYMRQIFAGVEHIHAHKVVHRDLKLENILMMAEDTLKISDFGFAADVPEDQTLTELCGTPGYLSPEMIRAALHKGSDDENRGYSYAVDMWGCGVILYTLLVGFPPFWHSNRMILMRLIMRGKFEFLSPYWDQVSDSAKDLVSKLLATNPQQRLTAVEAIAHPWMQPIPAAPSASRFKVAAWAVLAVMRMQSSARSSRQPQDARTSPAARPREPENTYTNYPVSVTDSMYKDQRVRKAIDECAFRYVPCCPTILKKMPNHKRSNVHCRPCRIYGHWVKKSNAQNRAALFENYLVRHTS